MGNTDESLGTYFSNTVLPDGRVALAYVADPRNGATSIQEIRIAITTQALALSRLREQS
jgi:hypothetical protein